MTREPTRVVLVDDHPMLREVLSKRIGEAPGLQVVGQAGTSDEASAVIKATLPHLVVIDIKLGERSNSNGLALASVVRKQYPKIRVLICSGHGEYEYVAEAKKADVHGYILKSRPTEEIVRAIQKVAGGATCYVGVEQPAILPAQLTKREREVLQLVARGQLSSEIAKDLGIETRTVEDHRSHLTEKLGAKNAVDLVRIAFRLGLIDLMD